MKHKKFDRPILDKEKEEIILDSIKKYKSNKTIIMITHKLNNYQGIINVILNQVLKNKNTVVLKGSKNRTRKFSLFYDKIISVNIYAKLINSNRKNKLVYISSFKMALSNSGSYKFRYKLVKELIKKR